MLNTSPFISVFGIGKRDWRNAPGNTIVETKLGQNHICLFKIWGESSWINYRASQKDGWIRNAVRIMHVLLFHPCSSILISSQDRYLCYQKIEVRLVVLHLITFSNSNNWQRYILTKFTVFSCTSSLRAFARTMCFHCF